MLRVMEEGSECMRKEGELALSTLNLEEVTKETALQDELYHKRQEAGVS